MGDLRDQLKKARLLSDKKARRLEHEERVDRKAKGRQGVERELREREEDLSQLRERSREQTRQAQGVRDQERLVGEELAACRNILASEVRGCGPGNIRWFFQLQDGQLPWLEVTPEELRRLQSGTLSVLRRGRPGAHVYGVLSTELTRRVANVLPESIAWAPRGVLPQ
jgi:uncharacterized protein YaiL (DUF2058 family)